MESPIVIDSAKKILIDTFNIPPNLVKTCVQGTATRSHGAIVLVRALQDPASRFLISMDMESGGYNPVLYAKIRMGHKVFQIGGALTLWTSGTREVIALFSAGAYNPEQDDRDMADATRKWYQSDERAKVNLQKLKATTDINNNGDSDQARRDMADGAHSFFYGWPTHLLPRINRTALRWVTDNPVFDPHLLSEFLRTNGFPDLAELPKMPVKNKAGKVEEGYGFFHDVHSLQYAAAIKLNCEIAAQTSFLDLWVDASPFLQQLWRGSRLKTDQVCDPEVPAWSGLGAWLNARVKFPLRTIGGADDPEKHNAAIDAATMAFDYMDVHSVLEGNYELKPLSDWAKKV